MAVNEDVPLTDDQADVLRELINIAYGRAAGLLYSFIGTQIHLHIPEVRFFDFPGFLTDIQPFLNDTLVTTSQTFSGKIGGDTLMLMPLSDAVKIAQLLQNSEAPSDADVLASVSEVGNIVTTSATRILSELSKVPITFENPSSRYHTSESLLAMLSEINYQEVISISTQLDIPENRIYARIYYLFHRKSISLLAQTLPT